MAEPWMPLLVAVPATVACILALLDRALPRRVVDSIALATALTVTVGSIALLSRTGDGRSPTWLGGWRPHHGLGVGIAFLADPLSAGLCVLIGVLATCALLYSRQYVASGPTHFHALMLFFVAGMVGFVLSADLFDMIVFFELMGAAAYALTGLHIEDETAVEGGLNFGLVNSLGAYLSLTGLALLYARTGQLGLAQLGRLLPEHCVDGLVVAAFVLVLAGFLVKGALVPFHFWLAEAHAVAPAPACVMFSGVMVELGLYGTARISLTVFGGVVPLATMRTVFLVLGVATALLGAVMCLGQRHLKRLLAFSTIAHTGLFTIGLAAFRGDALAGVVLYVAGHAAVKSALFLLAGVLLDRHDSVDEGELRGAGRGRWVEAGLFTAAAIGLAGMPPFGTALGKAIAEEGAANAGWPWIPVLFALVSALTAGAVLRFGAHTYLGIGDRREPEDPDEAPDDEEGEAGTPRRTPATMAAAIGILMAGGIATGVLPGLPSYASAAAQRLLEAEGYARRLLDGTGPIALRDDPAVAWSSSGLVLSIVTVLTAVAVAAAGLWQTRLPWLRLGHPVMQRLHRLHTGHIGDYVAWLCAGLALLAVIVGVPLLGR